MRDTVEGEGTACHRDRRGCWANRVLYGAARVVVISAGIRECPRVVRISSGIGMDGSGQVQSAIEALALYAGRRRGCRVWVAIIRYAIRRYADGRIRFLDGVA